MTNERESFQSNLRAIAVAEVLMNDMQNLFSTTIAKFDQEKFHVLLEMQLIDDMEMYDEAYSNEKAEIVEFAKIAKPNSIKALKEIVKEAESDVV